MKKYMFIENTADISIMMVAAEYTQHWVGCEAEVGTYCDEKTLEKKDNRLFREVESGALIPYDELPEDFFDNFDSLKLFRKIELEIPDEY